MMWRNYGPCEVCDAPMSYAGDAEGPHAYHGEACAARATGELTDCSCKYPMECHADCCPTCREATP